MHRADDGIPDDPGGQIRESPNPRTARPPVWTVEESPSSPGQILTLNIPGRPQITHHHTPEPTRLSSMLDRALKASRNALAEAYVIDTVVERAAARSANAFAEQSAQQVSAANAKVVSPVATLPSTIEVTSNQSLPSSATAHDEQMDQPLNLRHVLRDGAEIAENNPDLQVRCLSSNDGLTEAGDILESDVTDVPSSPVHVKQEGFSHKDEVRPDAGAQVMGFPSDVPEMTQSSKPTHGRVDDGFLSAPVIQQAPAQEPPAECPSDISASHVTIDAGGPCQQSHVSTARTERLGREVMSQIPETVSGSLTELHETTPTVNPIPAIPNRSFHGQEEPQKALQGKGHPTLEIPCTTASSANLAMTWKTRKRKRTGSFERDDRLVTKPKREPKVRNTRLQQRNAYPTIMNNINITVAIHKRNLRESFPGLRPSNSVGKTQIGTNEMLREADSKDDTKFRRVDPTSKLKEGVVRHEGNTVDGSGFSEGLKALKELATPSALQARQGLAPGHASQLEKADGTGEVAQDFQHDSPDYDQQSEQENMAKDHREAPQVQNSDEDVTDEPDVASDGQNQQWGLVLKNVSHLEQEEHCSEHGAQDQYDFAIKEDPRLLRDTLTKLTSYPEKTVTGEQPAWVCPDPSLDVVARGLRDTVNGSDTIQHAGATEKTIAEGTKQVYSVPEGKKQGFNSADGALVEQRLNFQLLDANPRNGTSEQTEKRKTTVEHIEEQEHVIVDGKQKFYSGPLPEAATEDHSLDIKGAGADSMQPGGAEEQTKDSSTPKMTPGKRGLGEKRCVKMEAELAEESASVAETKSTTTASVENANADSADTTGTADESGEDTDFGEAPNPEDEEYESIQIKPQQQDLEAQQAQNVKQGLGEQSLSIYDAIEKTGVPYNQSQIEAITSCLAKHFGLKIFPNVLLPASTNEQKHKKTRSKQVPKGKSKIVYEKFETTPRKLETLLANAKYFSRKSGNTAPLVFFRHSSAKDAAYFTRLMEETGLPLARSMEGLHQRDALLSLLQLEGSLRPVSKQMPKDSQESEPHVTEDTRVSKDQSVKHLRHQDALLSLLNFGTSFPTLSQYSYKNVLVESSAKAAQSYNQSTPYVQDCPTEAEESSLSAQDETPKVLGGSRCQKAELLQIEELEKRLHALEVENRFLKGMHDEGMLDEARVDL